MAVLTQGQRLMQILEELEITPYNFSKELGFKSPSTIYHIINGVNRISTKLVERIRNSRFKNINTDWLVYGFGHRLLNPKIYATYGNEYVYKGRILYPAKLHYHDIKRLALRFANILFTDPEHISYIVKVQVTAIFGLEFLYTTYLIEGDVELPSKCLSLIVRPDWRIFDFFDSWRIDQPTMRCQDCLELDSKSYQLAFDDAIYPILQDFQKSTSYFDEPPFVIAGEGYREVYRTDSRIGKGKQLNERKGA